MSRTKLTFIGAGVAVLIIAAVIALKLFMPAPEPTVTR